MKTFLRFLFENLFKSKKAIVDNSIDIIDRDLSKTTPFNPQYTLPEPAANLLTVSYTESTTSAGNIPGIHQVSGRTELTPVDLSVTPEPFYWEPGRGT